MTPSQRLEEIIHSLVKSRMTYEKTLWLIKRIQQLEKALQSVDSKDWDCYGAHIEVKQALTQMPEEK